MHDKRDEQEKAWHFWNLLLELEHLLWDRYESAFIERHLAEEDRWLSMMSDTSDNESLPF